MAVGRMWPVATLLNDGTVLVTGGNAGDDVGISSVERYDPSARDWTIAASLQLARYRHTATLLGDGTVLVVGGYVSGKPSRSAAIYHPDDDEWTTVDGMLSSRAAHFAALLEDGRVLVVGGWTQGQSVEPSLIATAEIYDPETGNWSTTGSMTQVRDGFSATRLEDGRVLVVGGGGGSSGTTPLGTLEAYDPGTGTWSIVGELVQARARAAVVQVDNGAVMVAGGTGTGSETLATTEGFSPEVGTVVVTGSMSSARIEGTITLLANGDVLVVGGTTLAEELGGPLHEDGVPTVDRYSMTGGWTTDVSPLQPRAYHAAVLLDDDSLLIVGGLAGGSGARLKTAERYVPQD